MKKQRLILMTSAALLAAGFLFLVFSQKEKNQNLKITGEKRTHFAYSQIIELYGNLNVEPQAGPEQRIGGISSHHFFVSGKIASFIAGLKTFNLKTIVIIGPNHFASGAGDILISEYAYQTPWGVLENNSEIKNKLINSGVAVNNEAPFEREHTISSLVGFIKYYLPDVKIVPVILDLNLKAGQAEQLAVTLNQILPEDAFVLASVDFSHHTTYAQAVEWDKKTAGVLEKFNFGEIYNCQMDSPASIYALLKYLELRGAKNMSYINLNAAELMGNFNYSDVTSYFFAYFGK